MQEVGIMQTLFIGSVLAPRPKTKRPVIRWDEYESY